MKTRTVELIIAIGLELLDWLSIILTEKRRKHDGKRDTEKKPEGGTT